MKLNEAKARLDAIEGTVEDRPLQARVELLRVLGELAGARLGLVYAIVMLDGTPYSVDMDGYGAPEYVAAVLGHSGTSMDELCARADGTPGDSLLDNPFLQPGFTIGETEWAKDLVLYVRFFEPWRIRSLLGSYFFIDGLCAGWAGVYRTLDEPGFSRRELERVKAHEARLTELFTAAFAFGRWRIPAGGAVGVLDVEGRVVQASADAPAWFREDHVCADLRAAARDFAQSQEPRRELFVRRHAVTLTRLVGKDGETVHARVVPTAGQPIPGIVTLSERRRQVALALVEGATIAEAARSLCMSPETVRTHLKAIYAHFGVSTRVALMKALRDARGLAPEQEKP